MAGPWRFTSVFSIATAGCNLHCKNCQNWQLSQATGYETENFEASPANVVAAARERGCPSIAYTCSEPIVFYEYVEDTAAQAHLLAWLAAVWVWCACRRSGCARRSDASRLGADGRVPASRRLYGPAIGEGDDLAG
ncbi:MAG: hypothetical protein HY303_06880 [Candidatus Wallbacteria bacterium]|nr:hypothetical protein [Candidatus Wallbacteria bacterium]